MENREKKSALQGGEREGGEADARQERQQCFLLHVAAAALVFACVCMQVISDLTSAYLQDKQRGRDGWRGVDEDNEVTLH